MKDVLDLKIAYQPPTDTYDAVKEVTVKLVAVDDYFAESRTLTVWIQIERAFTPGPRVTWKW
jgi:hypothetical protein